MKTSSFYDVSRAISSNILLLSILLFLNPNTVATSSTTLVDFGPNCSYSMGKMRSSISLAKDETNTVTVIPPSRQNIFIELVADADFDLSLSSKASGTVYLRYDESFAEGDKNWDTGNLKSFSYQQQHFKACVDSCEANFNVSFHEGTVFGVEGNKDNKGQEWIYIDSTVEEITVEVSAPESSGSGFVYWLWDCPLIECGNACMGISSQPTLAPSTIAPSLSPTIVAPTQAPTRVPTSSPTSPHPSPLPTLWPTPQPVKVTAQPTTPMPTPAPSLYPMPLPTPNPSGIDLNTTCSFHSIIGHKRPHSCTEAIEYCFKCFACCDDVASKMFVAGDLSFECSQESEFGEHCRSVGTYACGCYPRVYEVASSLCNTTNGRGALAQCKHQHSSLPQSVLPT